MRIVIVGQQAFGKAVLDAFTARGDQVAGVFAPPEKTGARPDPLVAAASERGVTVHRHARYSSDEAKQALAEHRPGAGGRIAAADEVVDEIDMVRPVDPRFSFAHPAFIGGLAFILCGLGGASGDDEFGGLCERLDAKREDLVEI